jgi:hypothetical protein
LRKKSGQKLAYPDYNKDGEEMEIESIEFFRAIARNMGGE